MHSKIQRNIPGKKDSIFHLDDNADINAVSVAMANYYHNDMTYDRVKQQFAVAWMIHDRVFIREIVGLEVIDGDLQ